jgi:hypothetical protein
MNIPNKHIVKYHLLSRIDIASAFMRTEEGKMLYWLLAMLHVGIALAYLAMAINHGA